MNKRNPIRPDTSLQWFDSAYEGTDLEMHAKIENVNYPLLTIIADNDESLWLEFESGKHLVQIPIARIIEMLETASQGVHSESWYEKNIYNKLEDN